MGLLEFHKGLHFLPSLLLTYVLLDPQSPKILDKDTLARLVVRLFHDSPLLISVVA